VLKKARVPSAEVPAKEALLAPFPLICPADTRSVVEWVPAALPARSSVAATEAAIAAT
jgi:hypothetical protein